MTGHGAKFGRKKEEAIAALLSQPSIEQAARVAGIGPKTLLRWLKLPEFQAAYREARLPDDARATKTVIPEWLVEELGKQGFRFDASGRPDMNLGVGGTCSRCDLNCWPASSD
jgi:hypothetical protein